MNKVKFLFIFTTYSNLPVVKRTLPSVIEEVKKNDAALIVFDSTEAQDNRNDKVSFLRKLRDKHDFFLILSDNLSLGHARNTCLYLGQKLFKPEYICMIDDDHGFKPGMIQHLLLAMKKYYGEKAPNGLRFGLFSGCGIHIGNDCKMHKLEDGHLYPDENSSIGSLGGTNGCFRCAPTSHWTNVLEGYNTDEYLISYYQSRSISRKNYFNGFTSLIVKGGSFCNFIKNEGRGDSSRKGNRWDDQYTASDRRAKFIK